MCIYIYTSGYNFVCKPKLLQDVLKPNTMLCKNIMDVINLGIKNDGDYYLAILMQISVLVKLFDIFKTDQLNF
jgi:hypothetical protein